MKFLVRLIAVLGFVGQAHATVVEPDWQALADRCFGAGVANFKAITTNVAAMDAFRTSLPEYAEKVFGVGPEVKSEDIKSLKVVFNYSVGEVKVHPDLDETVAAIEGMFVFSTQGPDGKVHNVLYTERIWARNNDLSYNCYYDENFRLGAVHVLPTIGELPYDVDTFQKLYAGLKEL